MTTKRRRPKCAVCGKSTGPVPLGIPAGKQRKCWRTKSMDWCGNEVLGNGNRMFMAYPREK